MKTNKIDMLWFDDYEEFLEFEIPNYGDEDLI
jgi:hypothetical protein